MGQHRALRQSRGPAGVLKEGQFIGRFDGGIHRFVRRLPHQLGKAVDVASVGNVHMISFLDHLEGIQEVFREGQIILDAGDDHALQRGFVQYLFHLVEDQVHADDGFRAGILQLVLQFPLHVHRVRLDHDRPRKQRAIVGDDRLGRVGKHDRHPVPLTHPQFHQHTGEAVYVLQKIPIRDALSHEVNRVLLGKLPGRLHQEVRQKRIGIP